MPSAVAIDGELRQHNGKITLLLLMSCLMAATGGFIFGYDLGVSGGVTSMNSFLKKFFPNVNRRMKADSKVSNYCKFDSQLLTLFTSSLYIAGIVASLFASPVTRILGRKASILVGGAAFLAGSALGAAASNLFMLIPGRILLGVGFGFANQSVQLYISEMALPRHRGKMNLGFEFGVMTGILVANLTNFATQKITGGWGWRISLALPSVPATILILCVIFLPETPNSLIRNTKNHQKAKLVLQRVRGTPDVQAEFDDLMKANSITKTIKHPFKNIVQRKYRPQLVMAIAIPFFQQVTGINVITFYAPLLFRTIGQGENASLLAAVVIRLVSSIFIVTSMLTVDKIGRKPLFMIGGIQMILSQIIVGGTIAVLLGDHGGLAKGYAYMVLIFLCLYVGGFALSWGPLGWLVPSEIFPLEIRSAGQSITVSVGLLFSFIIGQTVLAMLCHFKSGIFFFFAGWLVVMTASVHFFLPETKNVPIEQMENIWREHWFWERFVVDDDDKGLLRDDS